VTALKPILAVVVVFQMTVEDSPTCRALTQRISSDPGFAAEVDLLVADNSPEPQTMLPGFLGTYLHDRANEGLARRYNQALQIAANNGAEWLLLFDQDTEPTPAYFEELITLSHRLKASPEIAVIVPKLIMDGRILSPHPPVFRKPAYEVTLASTGVLGKDLRAFNSGALVRVSALQRIAGFPAAYWLDYLDHATFHRIQADGGQIYLMESTLQHELSDAIPTKPVNPVRLLNRLKAEERFYREHGSFTERLLHRLDLLRQVVGWGRRGQFEQARLRWKALMRLD
jgi:hypothetical protein